MNAAQIHLTMKYYIQIYLAIICLLFSLPATAQSGHGQAVKEYISAYNAMVSLSEEATVLQRSVTIHKDGDYDLVAVLNGDYKNRLNLQREIPAQLDELLPLTINDATVIMTSSTSVIVDNAGKVHYAFTIEDVPELPVLPGEKMLVFYGIGVGHAFSR